MDLQEDSTDITCGRLVVGGLKGSQRFSKVLKGSERSSKVLKGSQRLLVHVYLGLTS